MLPRIITIAVVTLISVLGLQSAKSARAGGSLEKREVAKLAVESRYPGVQAFTRNDRIRSLYGRKMTTGLSAEASANTFRLNEVGVFDAVPEDLSRIDSLAGDPASQGVMFNRATGQYKFSLIRYSQSLNGTPVFRGELKVLVRNQSDFPVVAANSSLRDLGNFAPANNAVIQSDVAEAAAVKEIPGLNQFSGHKAVIWAGVNELDESPVSAVQFVAEKGQPDAGEYLKWLFVADAGTGQILYRENLILRQDVSGSVSGNVTQGPGADECGAEALTPFPYSTATIQGGSSTFADVNGDFTISNAGTTQVTVESPIRGEFFQVLNAAGADELLTSLVTPPGPADFTHNAANTSEVILAQANGYANANEVRDWVLAVNPSYPVIATQTNFPVRVNRIDNVCPGNAWYDGSSINFCRKDIGNNTSNTSFAGISQHEYGHHLIQVGGSGQGEYGEGMSDCISALVADDPRLGVGFVLNQCASGIRNAANNCQLQSGCSSCGSSIHACGQLLSGCVWDTRLNLGVTDPANALQIVSDLTLNSILLHNGSSITPQITIDFLTLDDDDGDISNGTPHHQEICDAFGAHNMDCPVLALLQFDYPSGLPGLLPPSQASNIDVDVLPNVSSPVAGSGMVNYRIGQVGAFTADAMTETVPNEYVATLPAAQCGETVDFFFSADASGGGTFNDPTGGSTAPYRVFAASQIVDVASFDFEVTTGWTVSGNATDGQWNSGVPANGARGDPPSDFDGSGRCFLTDNVAGNSDVDGGTTTLTSPVFDLSNASDPRVSYARWFSNVEGDSPNQDTFVIEISNDGGSSWTNLETVGPSGAEVVGGWFQKSFNIADVLAPTNQVQMRFNASDLGAGSIVEAAVDGFEVFDVNCGFNAPLSAQAPDNVLKNRYISFSPNNGSNAVNFQVEMLSGPGTPGVVGWVGTPDVNGISRVESSPITPARMWPETVIQISDCEIVPVASYAVRATADEVSFSADVVINTIAAPVDGRFWGDVVGVFDAGLNQWTPANGSVNGFDVTAVLQWFLVSPSRPDISWVDLNPQVPDTVGNGNDILQAVNAFNLTAYPFVAPENCP